MDELSTDHPSLSDSQLSSRSSMAQLPHLTESKSRTESQLEDSATETQLEESSFFSENKDIEEVNSELIRGRCK